MTGFVAQELLWLVLPCLVLWWLFAQVQRRALDWLGAHVAPRFRGLISVYGPLSLRLHLALLLLMALALVIAAAGPFSRGKTETVTATGRLLLVIDGSASMFATDARRPAAGPEDASDESRSYSRLDFAKHVASSLLEELDGFRFALGSFSGTGVVHLPMTDDLALIEDALDALEIHSYYRNTGSSFARALDLVPHFVDRRGFRLQVVLLSDGESPVAEDYRAQLAALAEQNVPVHTVAIGTTEGQSRRILDFEDVVEKKDSPRALVEYHTRREDQDLRSISQATGGSFFVGEAAVSGRLAAEILQAGLEAEPFEHEAARTDLSGRFLIVFFAGFLFDALWFGRRPRRDPAKFELARLARPEPAFSRSPASRPRRPAGRGRKAAASAACIATWLLSSCAMPFSGGEHGSPRELAHRENERGIGKDNLRKHQDARPHYERSIGYDVEPQIPAYNLARSVVLTGDFSEAHDLFQEALLLGPDLAEAHFNDGITLYLWGRAERDPRDCDLARTRELWSQAARRFSSARAAAGREGEIGQQAGVNRAALADQLDEIDRLIAEPPEVCRGDRSSEASGGGASGEGAGTSGGAGSAGDGQEGRGQDGEEGGSGGGQGGEGDEGESGGDAGQGGAEPGAESGDEDRDASPAAPQGLGDSPADGSGSGELTQDELEQIRRQLELLAEQGREAGKYHRRTLPEQFRKGDWSNPDATIWW